MNMDPQEKEFTDHFLFLVLNNVSNVSFPSYHNYLNRNVQI